LVKDRNKRAELLTPQGSPTGNGKKT
jgi:hypothetical protein